MKQNIKIAKQLIKIAFLLLNNKVKVAVSNKQIFQGIMNCAYNSYLGQMHYHEWSKHYHRFISKRFSRVLPLSVYHTSFGNDVLCATDYNDHHQTKMFIIKQIDSFVPTKQKERPLWKIEIDKLQRFFGKYQQQEQENELE